MELFNGSPRKLVQIEIDSLPEDTALYSQLKSEPAKYQSCQTFTLLIPVKSLAFVHYKIF